MDELLAQVLGGHGGGHAAAGGGASIDAETVKILFAAQQSSMARQMQYMQEQQEQMYQDFRNFHMNAREYQVRAEQPRIPRLPPGFGGGPQLAIDQRPANNDDEDLY